MSPDEQAELKEMSLRLLAQVSWSINFISTYNCTDFVFLALPVRELISLPSSIFMSDEHQFSPNNINTFSREKGYENEWNDRQSENALI